MMAVFTCYLFVNSAQFPFSLSWGEMFSENKPLKSRWERAGVVFVGKSQCLSGCPQQGLADTAPLISAASLSE